HRHPDGWFPLAHGRGAGGVRGDEGSEGAAGAERPEGLDRARSAVLQEGRPAEPGGLRAFYSFRTTRQGLPAASTPAGTSLDTTDPAPMVVPSPMVTPG